MISYDKIKDRLLPALMVVVVAFICGTLTRALLVENGFDEVTCNSVFWITVVGIIVLYLCFMEGFNSLVSLIFNKFIPEKNLSSVADIKDLPAEEIVINEIAVTEIEAQPSENNQGKESAVTDQTVLLEEKVVALPTKINVAEIKATQFCTYSDRILADHLDEKDMAILHNYIRQYAAGEYKKIEKPIVTRNLDTYDLCHYGWNIWNHFRTMRQEETSLWLYKSFESLQDIEPSTIQKKMTHSDKGNYKIKLERDIQ